MGTAGLCRDLRNYKATLDKTHEVLKDCCVGRGHTAGECRALARLSFAGCCSLIYVRQDFCQIWRQSTKVCLHLLAANEGQDCPQIAQTADWGGGT